MYTSHFTKVRHTPQKVTLQRHGVPSGHSTKGCLTEEAHLSCTRSSHMLMMAINQHITHMAMTVLTTMPKKIAREHQVPDSEEAETQSIDFEAWLIQNRLLAVLEHLPKVQRERDATQTQVPTVRITQQMQLEQQGHQFTARDSPQAPYKCMVRGQQWTHQVAKHIIPKRRCPGPNIWGMPKGDRPWKLGDTQQVVLGSQITHTTHTLYWYKSIIFCMRCGHFASFKPKSMLRKLAWECPNNKGVYGQRVLKGISTDQPKLLGMQAWPAPDNMPTLIQRQDPSQLMLTQEDMPT